MKIDYNALRKREATQRYLEWQLEFWNDNPDYFNRICDIERFRYER